jgi:hypothetical protein
LVFLLQFGILIQFGILKTIWYFKNNLVFFTADWYVYYVGIWYISLRFWYVAPTKIWQPCSTGMSSGSGPAEQCALATTRTATSGTGIGARYAATYVLQDKSKELKVGGIYACRTITYAKVSWCKTLLTWLDLLF